MQHIEMRLLSPFFTNKVGCHINANMVFMQIDILVPNFMKMELGVLFWRQKTFLTCCITDLTKISHF